MTDTIGIHFLYHNHAVAGVKIILEIILTPPFVIPIVEPIVGITGSPDGNNFRDHEHSIIDFPSAEISGSTQQRVGNHFMLHSHFEESFGVSLVPAGPFTSVVNFLPPPLPFGFISSKTNNFNTNLNIFKKHYKNYFNDFISKNDYIKNSKEDWKIFLKNYELKYKQEVYEKFEN